MNVQALIFDLDHCLARPDELGKEFYQPALDAIRAANQGTLGEVALERALDDCWNLSLEMVAKIHGFSEAMQAAGWNASRELTIRGRMKGFPDLPAILEIEAAKFLVTSGFRRLQQSKIDALEIRNWFEEIHIDAIDEFPRTSKQRIFSEILDRHQFEPDQVLVVGDSALSEIAAGNALGMPTVQILRPGVVRSNIARFHIETLEELKALISMPEFT